jgi:hypothetical protein
VSVGQQRTTHTHAHTHTTGCHNFVPRHLLRPKM